MDTDKLSRMTRGWFVGDFSPTTFATRNVEVGVKNYNAGDKEKRHFHKVATEITLILKGKVMMNGVFFNEGDIIKVNPMESTDFVAITDTTTVVVKCPGEINDKYPGRAPNE